MYGMGLHAAVRLAVVDERLSHHEAGRRFGINRRTVKKMLSYSVPPGYRRTKPVRRPKLDGFTGIVDAILEADRDVPRKQRQTAQRIFERLRDEHGLTGDYTIVKDYVRARRPARLPPVDYADKLPLNPWYIFAPSRKLPCQVDHSKVETLALARTSAGVSPPRPSWSLSSLYSSIQAQVISRTSSRFRNSQVLSTSLR